MRREVAAVNADALHELKLIGQSFGIFNCDHAVAAYFVARIGQQKGVEGIFDYLRDLHDARRPCFSLKLLLAGPSMAGKSSMLQSLLRKDKTLMAPDERTIGLEIERLVLPDPSGRAVGGSVDAVVPHGATDLRIASLPWVPSA